MKKFFLSAFAAITVAVAVPASAATVVYNTSPNVGWPMGTGNNNTHTAVSTDALGNQVYLAAKETFVSPPASDGNGVYSFANGIPLLSFDWGVTAVSGSLNNLYLLLTLTDLNTGQAVSFFPLLGINDNYTLVAGTSQNSFRVNWFFPGAPSPNDTYQLDADAGFNGQHQFLTVKAKIGDGFGGAVPEPATWMMMLLGFGAIGFQMRRKRNPRLLQIA